MAVQANTNLTTDFAKAQSIDFTNRFVDGIQKLQELLGITRRTAMANGSIIKVYKNKVTMANGDVAEGDLIPLSKVEVEPANTYELAYKKYRKAVTLQHSLRFGDIFGNRYRHCNRHWLSSRRSRCLGKVAGTL